MSKATATQSSTAPDAVPAVSSASGRILVAIEMSKKSWILGIHSDLSAKISLYTIAAGDTTVMLRLIDAERDRLQRAGRTDVRVLTGYEAGRDGFWLHRFLSGRGIASRVLDSASIQVNRRARRAKTDRLDGPEGPSARNCTVASCTQCHRLRSISAEAVDQLRVRSCGQGRRLSWTQCPPPG